MFKIIAVSVVLITIAASGLSAGINAVRFEELSDKDISPEGKAALSFDKDLWKHAETEHFVYHFIDEKAADTILVHAEVYYKWIKDFFGITEDKWAKKNHIFIFTDRSMWDAFLDRMKRDDRPAAYTSGWELFIYRQPYWISPRFELSHEITHVIAFRFLEGPIPLFLNEGFSSFVASQLIKMQLGQDDYEHRPLKPIADADYIPLVEISKISSYPEKAEEFYREGEWFVRFLAFTYGRDKFYEFLRACAGGEDFRKAVERIYGADLEKTEEKFKLYASGK